MPKSYVIIGVSGAGKTSVAEQIAERAGLALHDFEDVFLETVGEDASIFLIRNGEEAYEVAALQVAKVILDREGVLVLAPGVTREAKVQERIKQLEDVTVVELFADTSTLMRRTGLNAPRSISMGPTRRILSDMVQQYRESYEGLADLVIDTSLSKPQYVADRILAFQA
ncbi:MAG: shikimate kinase [Actinomycetaceae bacterium]|nr:shikimate kinase [Actinomycetaceae bacterium]